MNTDRRRGGWVTTLLALVVLIVVGFLFGALAGFLWEEPGLVLAYLRGETESVEWSEPAPVAAEPPPFAESEEAEAKSANAVTEFVPDAAAPPVPKPAAPVAAVPKPPAAAKPASKPLPAKVASLPAGRFSVQVGAFGDRATAEKLVARLRARGYDSYVKAADESGGSRYRVRVGPVDGRARAEDLAAKLQKGEKLPTWILDEGAS